MLLNCGAGKELLRVPWIARRSNQSILKEINPEYSLEGLMLKLKCQYFGHLKGRTHWKRSWCWERLKAREGDNRGQDRWMASPTRWTWVWASSRRWCWTGKSGVLLSRYERATELKLMEEDMIQAPAMWHILAISPLGLRSESSSSAWGSGWPSPQYSSKLLLIPFIPFAPNTWGSSVTLVLNL